MPDVPVVSARDADSHLPPERKIWKQCSERWYRWLRQRGYSHCEAEEAATFWADLDYELPSCCQ